MSSVRYKVLQSVYCHRLMSASPQATLRPAVWKLHVYKRSSAEPVQLIELNNDAFPQKVSPSVGTQSQNLSSR